MGYHPDANGPHSSTKAWSVIIIVANLEAAQEFDEPIAMITPVITATPDGKTILWRLLFGAAALH